MIEELPPLPSDLSALLEVERTRPPPPDRTQAKVWAALAAQLPTVPLPRPPASQPPAVRRLPHWLAGKLPVAVAAFAAGGGAGIAGHARWVRAHANVEQVVAAQVPASPALPQPPAAFTAPPKAPVGPPPSHLRAPPARPVERAESSDERLLLEMGRTAMARGQARAAYEAMLQHEKRFPKGALAEERDALRIQALVALGQLDAARLLADDFEQAYPHSLLLPVVRRAVSR